MSPTKAKEAGSAGVSVAPGQGEAPEARAQEPAVDTPASETQQAGPAGQDDATAVKKAEFQAASPAEITGKPAGMDILLDVVVPVAIELGRTTMHIRDILGVCQGSVIELDRAAGEPVDILVSGKLLGKGEVVVMNDRFGVRITELASPVEGVEEE